MTTTNELYERYKNMYGGPGDTTRTLTYRFLILKNLGYSDTYVCRHSIEEKLKIYRNMGMILENNINNKILGIAQGYFPIVIFADIFISYHNNLHDQLEELISTLDVIIDVMVDEFNMMMNNSKYKIEDLTLLYSKISLFLKEFGPFDEPLFKPWER